MRYHFFLHYGWFFQNLGKEAVRTFMHTTVCEDLFAIGKYCWKLQFWGLQNMMKPMQPTHGETPAPEPNSTKWSHTTHNLYTEDSSTRTISKSTTEISQGTTEEQFNNHLKENTYNKIYHACGSRTTRAEMTSPPQDVHGSLQHHCQRRLTHYSQAQNLTKPQTSSFKKSLKTI